MRVYDTAGLLIGFLYSWEGERDRRTVARFGLNPDVAAVALDDALTQRQTDTSSRILVGRVEALEHFEDTSRIV